MLFLKMGNFLTGHWSNQMLCKFLFSIFFPLLPLFFPGATFCWARPFGWRSSLSWPWWLKYLAFAACSCPMNRPNVSGGRTVLVLPKKSGPWKMATHANLEMCIVLLIAVDSCINSGAVLWKLLFLMGWMVRVSWVSDGYLTASKNRFYGQKVLFFSAAVKQNGEKMGTTVPIFSPCMPIIISRATLVLCVMCGSISVTDRQPKN